MSLRCVSMHEKKHLQYYSTLCAHTCECVLRRRAEEAAAKAAAAEAKARREVEKRAIKKERQRLRAAVAAGADGNRLLSEGVDLNFCHIKQHILFASSAPAFLLPSSTFGQDFSFPPSLRCMAPPPKHTSLCRRLLPLSET